MLDLIMATAPPVLPGAAVPESAQQDVFGLGMPLPALLALIALISAVLTALISGWARKFRTPADDTKDRVVVLDASDRLIQRFEALLKESDARHKKEIDELRAQVDGLEAEVAQMREERSGLVSAIRAVIAIARRYGGHEAAREIQALDLPDTVRV